MVDSIPQNGKMIELGVAGGKFAVECLNRRKDITYIGIDKWDDHHNLAEMSRAVSALDAFGRRAILMRSLFTDAVALFKDECVDLVYIDGYAHTGQNGGRTLNEWWQVVKSGGIMGGHDYHPQWQPTIVSVDAFVAEHGLELHIIQDDPYPSWYVVKG